MKGGLVNLYDADLYDTDLNLTVLTVLSGTGNLEPLWKSVQYWNFSYMIRSEVTSTSPVEMDKSGSIHRSMARVKGPQI